MTLNTNYNVQNNKKQTKLSTDEVQYYVQLFEVDVLDQHCDQVEKLWHKAHKNYKQLTKANKAKKALNRQSNKPDNISSNIFDKNELIKCFEELNQASQRLTLRWNAALQRAQAINLASASSRQNNVVTFYFIDDITLENRIAKAKQNKQDNCGVFHNLENPYTSPNWAPALIENVYKPSLALMDEIRQNENKETCSPESHGVSSVADFSQYHESKVEDWEDDWVFVFSKTSRFYDASFDIDFIEQGKYYQSDSAERVKFNFTIYCLPYIDAEMTILSKLLPTVSNTKIKTALYSVQSLQSVLKPVSLPQINDCDIISDPVFIHPSLSNRRYFKNIPRLIEFAHYAEKYQGIRMHSPTGYYVE